MSADQKSAAEAAKTKKPADEAAKAKKPATEIAKTKKPADKTAKAKKPADKTAKTKKPADEATKTKKPTDKAASTKKSAAAKSKTKKTLGKITNSKGQIVRVSRKVYKKATKLEIASYLEEHPEFIEKNRNRVFKRKCKYIITGKYRPHKNTVVAKTVFIGNLAASVDEQKLREVFRRFRHKIVAVRILRSSGAGKKAERKDGKVVAWSRGAAFITVKTVGARNNLLKRKKVNIDGKILRIEKARVKKAHVSMLEAGRKRKLERSAKKQLKIKELKKNMYKNMLKNKKHAKNFKNRVQKKLRKGVKTVAKSKKCLAMLPKSITFKNDRKRLSGDKARKARARMTRK